MDKHRNNLIQAYKQAGEAFLAYRLKSVFRKVESDEDRILHNAAVEEVFLLIGDRMPLLLKALAWIVMHPPKPKQRFLSKLARKILDLARIDNG